jgi:hypothetical protein
VGCDYRRYRCFPHFTIHCYTHWCPLSLTVSTSRCLVTDLTQWRFFSCCGHAFAHWLTLHTGTRLFSTELFISTFHGPNRVSTSRCLVTALTQRRFFSCCGHTFAHWLTLYTGTRLFSTELFISTFHGPNRKHRFQQYPNCCVYLSVA